MTSRPVEFLFWLSLAVIAYIYAGYPLLVWLLGRLRRMTVRKTDFEPFVSILIAAHDEEAAIAQTIQNKLDLDYPRDRLEIIVVSDASTDRTDEIARSFAPRGVVVLRQEPRNGKSAALNLAVERARGEILVFADANSVYERQALRHLVANFADPAVGYVTGTLAYVSSARSMTGEGCGLYMKYENFVRRSETRVGSVVGVNGGVDAMRRSLYRRLSPDDLPDLVLPLYVVQCGYRVIFEPAALLAEKPLSAPGDEYRMRVRVALRALWTVAEMRGILDVRRHGFYAVQVFSHKVLRYTAFVFMATLYGTSLWLAQASPVYAAAVVLQTAAILLAAAGFCAARNGSPGRLLAVPYYFALVNFAALHACWRFLNGNRARTWTPRLG
ncbi:MAG TPA: glycosyltransferase family 2 protein [Vicinamibacterales bacterium]|nr:glycosyltransferase family 2 protein [Vicinamibacterales bacterium]